MAGKFEDNADAPEKGGIGGDGGSSSWGEAGGLPQSKGGIWRCLMECKVGVWAMNAPQVI